MERHPVILSNIVGVVGSAALVLTLTTGCSVYMAASQPEKKDLSALQSAGMPRDHVIAKLGAPTSSTKYENGTRMDVYEFYEGSATGWKVGRATFHAVADVFTLGLWEIIGTPTEMAVKGDKMTARAQYDRHDHLVDFKVMGGSVPAGSAEPDGSAMAMTDADETY